LASLGQCQLPPVKEREAQRILDWFGYVVPAQGASSLAVILEAGWLAYEDETLWERIPEVRNKRDRAEWHQAKLQPVVLTSVYVIANAVSSLRDTFWVVASSRAARTGRVVLD
jgi:hypothetical protein